MLVGTSTVEKFDIIIANNHGSTSSGIIFLVFWRKQQVTCFHTMFQVYVQRRGCNYFFRKEIILCICFRFMLYISRDA